MSYEMKTQIFVFIIIFFYFFFIIYFFCVCSSFPMAIFLTFIENERTIIQKVVQIVCIVVRIFAFKHLHGSTSIMSDLGLLCLPPSQ